LESESCRRKIRCCKGRSCRKRRNYTRRRRRGRIRKMFFRRRQLQKNKPQIKEAKLQ
jgi:hypothetical protein